MAATTFSAFFSLKSGKWGPWKGNGDLLGTQKLKKVPMGTRVPKWGPTWEQCSVTSLTFQWNTEASADSDYLSFFSFTGWLEGLDPKFQPHELCHGFSASWESSI